jgi:hypothetical protein
MTNIRLRIEDTVPTVGFGPSDTPLVAPLTPAPFGTI